MANVDFRLVKQQNETEHEKPLNIQLRELDIDGIKAAIEFLDKYVRNISELMHDYDFKVFSDDELLEMHTHAKWCCVELTKLMTRYNNELLK